MEDQTTGTQLDDIETDYTLRLDQLALEGVGVLRELMHNAEVKPELRASVARVSIDLAYRAEALKKKEKEGSGET
jgi:hypothetical protein